ncbi:MAG: NADAR family protein [Pseudomonadota bacterium]
MVRRSLHRPRSEAYPTAEHWMMAEKARLFRDAAAEARIMEATSPGAAKARGREVKGFREADWAAKRFDIVVAGNLLKFGQHAALKQYLMATGERILVEASPRDAVWGAGVGKADAAFEQPERWPGLNLLGFALMRVRRALRDAERETLR